MTRFAIDPPTLLRIVSDEIAIDPGHSLVAPTAIRSQALTLLLTAVREGRRGERDALRLHERMTELKMRVLGDRVSRGTAWRLARQHDWADLYAAEYIAVAKLQADALIAGDPVIAAAAEGVQGAEHIVPLAGIGALSAPDAHGSG